MKALKKLFAAALASSLSFAANAQTPPAAAEAKPAAPAFQIYGTLNVNAQWSQAKDATDETQDVSGKAAISTDSTNIGIRGTLDLGDTGLKGTFQCETSAQVDGISVSGICNRNSRVGITSAIGTIWYGNWDTPLKASAYGTKAEDPFGNTDVFGFQSILGSPGANYRSGGWKTATNTVIYGFDIRANNSIGFHSAKFGGLSFKAQYSVPEFANQTGTIEPQLFGAVVNYDQGPLSVFAAYERHDDAFGLNGITGDNTGNPTSLSSVDWAWRAGAGYELPLPFGPLTVSGAVEQLFYEQENAPGLTKADRLAWQVGAKQRVGSHELRLRFSQALEGEAEDAAGNSDTVDDSGASMIAAGYAYHFTKTFQVYLTYAQIMNQDLAQYTFTIGGAPTVAGATPEGADPQVVALGVRYAF